jgi:flagella basal body P-ring formation protein FlgA
MKLLTLMFLISATWAGVSKQDLVNYLTPMIGPKINTKDFNIVIEKMPSEAMPENVNFGDVVIDDLIIPPQQRSFQVNLKLKNGERLEISGKIEWMANIPILLRAIGPTEIINLSDIGTQSYPIDQLSAMVVMDGADLIGKSSTHSIIKPGLPVERSLLKNPTIIKRGDMIDVVYRTPHLTVSTKAQATQELACGDTGTFEIQRSNSGGTAKKISAKVVGPSTAEISHGNV